MAFAAPLLLLLVFGWRGSLQTSYLPAGMRPATAFDEAFIIEAERWHARKFPRWNDSTPLLAALIDPGCSCASPALRRLRQATSLRVEVVDVRRETGWTATLPATPSLLVFIAGKLRYAGPIDNDGACTVGAQRLSGLRVVDAARSAPVREVVARGCYCRQ